MVALSEFLKFVEYWFAAINCEQLGHLGKGNGSCGPIHQGFNTTVASALSMWKMSPSTQQTHPSTLHVSERI